MKNISRSKKGLFRHILEWDGEVIPGTEHLPAQCTSTEIDCSLSIFVSLLDWMLLIISPKKYFSIIKFVNEI
jgi:hypothetical protein